MIYLTNTLKNNTVKKWEEIIDILKDFKNGIYYIVANDANHIPVVGAVDALESIREKIIDSCGYCTAADFVYGKRRKQGVKWSCNEKCKYCVLPKVTYGKDIAVCHSKSRITNHVSNVVKCTNASVKRFDVDETIKMSRKVLKGIKKANKLHEDKIKQMVDKL